MTAVDAPPHDPTKLYLPTLGREIERPWFLPDERTIAEQRRIMESTYFLIRVKGNASLGENLFCAPAKGGCGAKGKSAHECITLRCVPQPFSGITGGLVVYYRAVADNHLADSLSIEERTRLRAIRDLLSRFGAFDGLPDLATHHPEMAKRLTAGLGERDEVGAAMALGILEPVPFSLAKKYRDRIRARGCRPRFDLPGMED